MQIKTYEGDYDRFEFYGLMGRFFAEPQYKKEMPYLVNKENTVWFVALDAGKVVGFVAVNETKNIIKLAHDYVEESYRRQGLYQKLNKHRLKYVKDKKKPLEIIVKEKFLIDYWTRHGFKIYRTSGVYSYMRKECIE